jgi:hypothetical protein
VQLANIYHQAQQISRQLLPAPPWSKIPHESRAIPRKTTQEAVPFLSMLILAQRGDPMPLCFPFIVVGIWLLVSYTVAQEGWASFAVRYGRSNRPKRPVFGSPHTRFNGSWHSNYNNVVRIVPSPEGIWFSTSILFRAFHPPFIIPWKCVTRVETLSYWCLKGYRVHIQDEVGEIVLRLRWGFRDVLVEYRPDLLHKAITDKKITNEPK